MGKKKLCPYYNSWNDLYQAVAAKNPKAKKICFKWCYREDINDKYDYTITMATLKQKCWDEYQEKLKTEQPIRQENGKFYYSGFVN